MNNETDNCSRKDKEMMELYGLGIWGFKCLEYYGTDGQEVTWP